MGLNESSKRQDISRYVAEMFDDMANEYDYLTDLWYRHTLGFIDRILLTRFNLRLHTNANSVLDVGCRTGIQSFRLASMGYVLDGIDISTGLLAVDEKVLGSDHPDVAMDLNNLAALYHMQGQFAQAESLYKYALAIDEKALGPGHPDVATSLNNLASLYKTQGQYAQAESLYKRALAIDEKALGPDHPGVATDLNNLAGLYDAQDQYTLAEPLYKHALAIMEKALGPDHPDVATGLENLAMLYRKSSRDKEAEALERRAAGIRAIQR